MKITTTILFFLLSATVNGQAKFIGQYKDPFTNTLDIFDDSTFKYSSKLTGRVACKVGTWTISNNTISLKVLHDCDTSNYKNAPIPTKFRYKKRTFYEVANGKLIKKRNMSIPPGKEINAGYVKQWSVYSPSPNNGFVQVGLDGNTIDIFTKLGIGSGGTLSHHHLI